MAPRICFVLVALIGLLLPQANAVSSLSLSVTTSSGCRTQYGSGSTQPTPIPTAASMTTVTITSTVSTITTPSIVVEYADASTTTQYTATTGTIIFATETSPTLTKWEVQHTTYATATWPSTVCTNSVTPSSVTEYTGMYTPVSGQATTLPETYPVGVFCSGQVQTYLFVWPITTSGTSTRTSTPVTTINSYTATTTRTITYATVTKWATTVTATATVYKVAHTVDTISTACEETYTTTYDAKCAPTNIIGAINGVGLVSGTYADGIAVTYGPDVPGDQYHSDASLCCQLCLDNDGCEASMAGPAFDAACGLYYVWNATSGGPAYGDFVFSYQTAAGLSPGESTIVQSGSGLITYEGECCT